MQETHRKVLPKISLGNRLKPPLNFSLRTKLSATTVSSVDHKIDCDGQAFAADVLMCCAERGIRISDN